MVHRLFHLVGREVRNENFKIIQIVVFELNQSAEPKKWLTKIFLVVVWENGVIIRHPMQKHGILQSFSMLYFAR